MGERSLPARIILLGEQSDQLQAGNIGPDRLPFPGYRQWLSSLTLDGEGVRVAVVDTGVDDSHPALVGRVVTRTNYGALPGGTDVEGHGTSVAGALGGEPPPDEDGHDHLGFSYGLGVAPAVELVDINFSSITKGSGEPVDLLALLGDVHESGAAISNGSWHTTTYEQYSTESALWDAAVRDASVEKADDQPLLMVFAAGNSGEEPTPGNNDGNIASTTQAKNIISVGATSSGGTATPLRPSDPDIVYGYSSKGPTFDFRIFPTLVAPGGNTFTARADLGALSVGACVPALFSPVRYHMCGGTSMAAPHVSGAGALIHQWWKRTHSDPPSPAMVKAILVNGAQDLGTPDIPNNTEGWGRVNLRNVFADQPIVYHDQNQILTDPDDTRSYLIEVADPARPLKITLAWTDAPALAGAPLTLVNDLDLHLEQLDGEGQVIGQWHGNVFEDGWSIHGSEADRFNNLEGIHLQAPQPGRYRITIRAHNLPGDALPNNTDPNDQDYALVIRNARAP